MNCLDLFVVMNCSDMLVDELSWSACWVLSWATQKNNTSSGKTNNSPNKTHVRLRKKIVFFLTTPNPSTYGNMGVPSQNSSLWYNLAQTILDSKLGIIYPLLHPSLVPYPMFNLRSPLPLLPLVFILIQV